ncbi:hypothetical protein Xmer_13750 [Xanthomonas campestris pv. merremiae]|nr:hypothetical protein [Xanthomonas campestris pv. merremiae]
MRQGIDGIAVACQCQHFQVAHDDSHLALCIRRQRWLRARRRGRHGTLHQVGRVVRQQIALGIHIATRGSCT